MCGRFNMISDPLTQLIMQIVNGEITDVSLNEIYSEDRYNVAPTDIVPVLLKTQAGQWQLHDMRWWLVPNWSPEVSSKYTMFNAKSETLAQSRAFKMPFQRKRCIVPVSSYYEWQKQAGATKVPYLIAPAESNGFAFAGLWDTWERQGKRIDSCTIITGAAPESMKHLHHRVPIHLGIDEVDRWLNLQTAEDELAQLLSPHLREPMLVTPVSSYVGNSRNKDARCIEPLGSSDVIH